MDAATIRPEFRGRWRLVEVEVIERRPSRYQGAGDHLDAAAGGDSEIREWSRETMLFDQDQPWEQTPHLAPALTAVILGVVSLVAFAFYARSLEYRSIMALAADEAIIQRAGQTGPAQEPGQCLATGGPGDRLPAASLWQLGIEPVGALQSAFSCNELVP